jgi:membrane protein DedA with SNARE-associated domain
MPATSRATAGEAADLIRDAIILLQMETVLGWVTQYGSVSLFFLMMLGIVGLPVPDETLLVFSGYLIFKGTLEPVFTFSMAFLGSVSGITLSYFLGRVYGLKLVHKYGRYFHLTEERYQKVHNWFEKIGRWSLFFGYYIAGVRHFTAMVAGASDLEYPRFAAFAYCGAFTWVLSFLSLGYFVGDKWASASEQLHRYILTGCLAIGVILGLYLLVRRISHMKRS